MTKDDSNEVRQKGAHRVAMLWQAALTATVQVRVIKEGKDHSLAAWAIKSKEFSRVEASLSAPEGYPAFAQRLMLAISDLPAKMTQSAKLEEIATHLLAQQLSMVREQL